MRGRQLLVGKLFVSEDDLTIEEEIELAINLSLQPQNNNFSEILDNNPLQLNSLNESKMGGEQTYEH